LDVAHKILLPIKTHIRVLVTAADVILSWSVPSFGVSVNMCQCRLNQAIIFVKKAGVF